MEQPRWQDDLSDIDHSADPSVWVEMLRGMWAGDRAKGDRFRRLFGALELAPGARVLDLGCGTGGAARFLAELMENRVDIVGVDPSALAIREAHRIEDELGLNRTVRYAVMDGRSLGFPRASF